MIQAQRNKVTQILSSRGITDGATASASFDMQGADYATLILNFKTEEGTDSGNTTISLLESDDTVVTNHATFVANRSEDLTTGHNVVYHFDTKSRKRYLRLTVTAATVTGSDVTFAASIITGRLGQEPSATADMVGSTNDAVVIVA